MLRAVILGSGASVPTLQRHAPAVAVQREGDIYLWDCGEGTQLQWRRANLRFGKLRAICISHLHGDHVNGLVGLLQSLSLTDRAAPLAIHGPPGLRGYLRALRRHLGLRLAYPLQVEEDTGGTLLRGEGYGVMAAPLDHGVPTLGFALVEDPRPGRFDVEAARGLGVPEGPLYGALQRGETVTLEGGRQVRPEQVLGPPRPGRKLVYCVDTRPCRAAVELARGADVFICDATFAAELEAEAARRGHCTAAQAAAMAREAGVGRLLLIHVSARYHDPRPLLEEARHIFPETEVARDLMEVEL